MGDIFYFLDCRPNDQTTWRSAVMRYASANLKTLNSGNKPTETDRFTYVTSSNARKWEGFMYGKPSLQRSRLRLSSPPVSQFPVLPIVPMLIFLPLQMSRSIRATPSRLISAA